MMRWRMAVLAAAVLAVLAVGRAHRAEPLAMRWVYLHSRLVAPGGPAEANDVLRRAAKAGYNGVVLSEMTLNGPAINQKAERDLAELLRTARDLKLEVIPTVFHVGNILKRDPNLAEGLPVRDSLYIVRNGLAVHSSEPPVLLANPGFEVSTVDAPAGWQPRLSPNALVASDTSVRRSGSRSVRFEARDPGKPIGDAYLGQTVTVAPFRQYHVSVWVRTEGYDAASSVQAYIRTPGERSIAFTSWRVEPTQGWVQMHAVVNSLDNTRLIVRLGAWQARKGKLWLDTASIEEIGLLNLIRRSGCPMTVRRDRGDAQTGDTTGEHYDEGRDFDPVRDPLMGRSPTVGAYDVYHQPPAGIRIARGSRIREGERLRVSYYHVPVIYERRVTQCLSDPAVYTGLREEARRVLSVAQARTYMMSTDEMRAANWCETCRARGMTPGRLVADYARRCIGILRDARPDARIVVWSDMFDPNHNARDNYFLVNGPLAGSWEGLPADVIVANWYFDRRRQNMPWFAERGHRQLLAGYYDRSPAEIGTWLADASGIKGVEGAMYTTWRRNFADLEAFAATAWGSQP